MISRNLKAFLDMLAESEGTARIPNSDNGYRVIVGGSTFQSYADHPRQKIFIKRINNYSTAAGRYQILARYFDAYKKTLNLKDFSPAAQDKIATQMIREQKALTNVELGNFDMAVSQCRNIWASLPGAGYGQLEHSLDKLRAYYIQHGGKIGAA